MGRFFGPFQPSNPLVGEWDPKHFLSEVPERDLSGHVVPDWRRHMMAKQAAEKAKKESEEKMRVTVRLRNISHRSSVVQYLLFYMSLMVQYLLYYMSVMVQYLLYYMSSIVQYVDSAIFIVLYELDGAIPIVLYELHSAIFIILYELDGAIFIVLYELNSFQNSILVSSV